MGGLVGTGGTGATGGAGGGVGSSVGRGVGMTTGGGAETLNGNTPAWYCRGYAHEPSSSAPYVLYADMTSYMVERGVCPIQEYFRLKKVTLPNQEQVKKKLIKLRIQEDSGDIMAGLGSGWGRQLRM